MSNDPNQVNPPHIRLKILMLRSDLNHRELAKKIKRSGSAVSRWVNGSRAPSPRNLNKLAKVLGEEVRDIFSHV